PAAPHTAEINGEAGDIDQEIRKLMAAEEASMKGFFGRIIAFYERWLKRALEHPLWLGAGCVVLVALSFVCYQILDRDSLPEMDEGGFIVDYWTPAGSSLQETDRMVSHIERILHSTPEVESTSRRTGMELGLAAVTEANRGDVTVKLKAKRDRDVDKVIKDVRDKISQQEPGVTVEFPQLLGDMIGDLTGEPQPVVVKLFSSDAKLLEQTAPRVADAIEKAGKEHIVDIKNGIEDTISGPATQFNVNTSVAAKAGFTAEEVSTNAEALLQGVPAATPLVANNRAYTIRVRFPDQSRSSFQAMNNTLLISSSGRTATLGSLAEVVELPGQTEIRRENLQRKVEVTARLENMSLSEGIKI